MASRATVSASYPSGMASRAISYWRMMVHRVGGNRSFTTSTTPKSRAFAGPLHDMFGAGRDNSKAVVRGDFVPVYVALGMIVLSVSLGLLTVKHQLLYTPNAYVKKKRREMVPAVVDEAERFIHKSLFRRLAHVQEFDRVLDDPIRGDPLAVPKKDDLEDDVDGGSSFKGFFFGSPPMHTNNPLVRDVHFVRQTSSFTASTSPSGMSMGRAERMPSCGASLFGEKSKRMVRI